MGNSERQVLFRSSPRYWLGIGVPYAIVMLMLPVILFLTMKIQFFFIPALFLAGAVWLLYPEIARAVSARVTITAETVSVELGKDRYTLNWSDIRAMQIQRYGLGRGITFLLEDGSEYLPGRFFDLARLLPVVQSRLPLEVQDPLAYRTLPAYQEWHNQLSRKFAKDHFSYSIDLGWIQRIGGVGLIAVSLVEWFRIFRSDASVSIWVLMVTLIGVWLLIESFQFLLVNNDEIELTRLSAHYRLRWTAIQRIYHQPEIHSYGLQDQMTRIVLPPAIFWFGKDKKQAIAAVKYKIHGSGMVPRESFLSAFWTTRTIAKGRRKLTRTHE